MPDKEPFLRGQLLLDSGQLRGSFFQRTVVLICQHDAEGAFGLVLNRATGSNVGDLLVADLPDLLKSSPLYLGGPVQPSALSFLHTDSFIPDANVLPNLNLGHLGEKTVLPALFAEDHLPKLVGRSIENKFEGSRIGEPGFALHFVFKLARAPARVSREHLQLPGR